MCRLERSDMQPLSADKAECQRRSLMVMMAKDNDQEKSTPESEEEAHQE